MSTTNTIGMFHISSCIFTAKLHTLPLLLYVVEINFTIANLVVTHTMKFKLVIWKFCNTQVNSNVIFQQCCFLPIISMKTLILVILIKTFYIFLCKKKTNQFVVMFTWRMIYQPWFLLKESLFRPWGKYL